MIPKVVLVDDGKYKAFSFKIVKILILFVALGVALLAVSVYMTRYFDLKYAIFQPRSRMIQLCPDQVEKNDLSRWIKPPALMHEMSDEELLWRASFDPELKKVPYNRVPKVAFMFLTKGPLPLLPLWEKFFKGNEDYFSIYVHALPSYKDGFPSDSVFHGRQIPSKVAEWGKMSMCDAERRLLANALLDYSNERFILLSESCIPLYNFTTTYKYLTESKHSFVGSFDDRSPYGRGRYNPKMEPEISLSQWRKGAQWFEVDRALGIKIISDVKYHPKFRDFCKPGCYVDEHYFPTMLNIEAPERIANRSVTLVDWSRGGPHPATFGGRDVNQAFLKRLKEGKECLYNGRSTKVCFLFARKFAPSALGSLLKNSDLLGF